MYSVLLHQLRQSFSCFPLFNHLPPPFFRPRFAPPLCSSQSLLHHRACTSNLSDFVSGTFFQ